MNKTKVINALSNIFIFQDEKKLEEYKEIKQLKISLKKRTKEDIDSIKYIYEKLLNLYWLSAKEQISKKYCNWLGGTVKEILKSNIDVNYYNIEEIKSWDRMGIL